MSGTRDPTDTRASAEAAAVEAHKAAAAQRLEVEDLKWLMDHPQGRRVVWRLLEKAGVYRSTFNSSGSVSAFNEGQRNMGLFLLAQIHEHAPDASLAMLKESKN